MESKNKLNIAFMVDGSFLPIRNGTCHSIYYLMHALSKTGKVNPSLIICYRGWDDPKLYYRKTFNTVFLKPADYYNDTGILNYVFNIFNIQAAHIYNAEEIFNTGKQLQKTNIKIIYEAVNIDHVLYRRLGRKDKDVASMKSLQTKAFYEADHIFCRSIADKKHIIEMGINSNKITAYSGAINVGSIEFKERKRKRHQIVFLGHMYYPPNENALNLIAHHVLPRLKKMDSRYVLTIIGNIPKSTTQKYSRCGIVFRGGVNDLSGELLKYDIALAPIFEGSGTRLKILDYLASGLPTITTSLGIEGLKKDISKYVEIENDINKYAERIHYIMKNLSNYKIMLYNGRKFLEDNYDWDKYLDPFLKVYQEIL